MDKKKTLLWVGDAIIHSGFARVTHNILAHLVDRWDVHVLGVCYTGDPHGYPYPIYPASLSGDIYGLGRLQEIIGKVKPDAILILQDPWIVPFYLDRLNGNFKGPVVASMPVDAPNIPKRAAHALSKLTHAIFWTEFGLKEAQASGFSGDADVIPFGVDLERYVPVPRAAARARLKIPQGAYVVGNVNTNHPRKRLDLTMLYFAEWIRSGGAPSDAKLMLHCAHKPEGWDLMNLADYLGLKGRMIITNPGSAGQVDESAMPFLYSAMDVQVTTTQGEGWGLTQCESMACGVPQIVPEWAALAEWPRGAVRYVPVTSHAVTAGQLGTIGGIVDRIEFVKALSELHDDPTLRVEYGARARAKVEEPQFRWDAIADRYHEVLSEVVVP